MKTIAYSSPFVPPEWIAAHGLRPQWLRLSAATGRPPALGRGICPYAGTLIDAALAGIDASALVLSTACDQMRYAAALLASRGSCPVFLLNVPSTWQTAAVRNLYRGEVERLGRFLATLGGIAPESAELARVMLTYDQARHTLCEAGLPARQFAEALAELHSTAFDVAPCRPTPLNWRVPRLACPTVLSALLDKPAVAPGELDMSPRRWPTAAERAAGIPVAILGGPLLEADYDFFDLVERSGGRVVLDATEGGPRTMPRPFDPERVAANPVQELADAYFDGIPDAFRRPNSGLYEWLGRELPDRHVRGIIFRRYAWCDLWHAELHRLKRWTRLPVLEIDASPDDTAATNRTEGRIEAFMEMLA
jgi:benzoyl-CoA reductase/2-hydroxyglutaryl-CoA dehydratase subunit BcrC/BadD/HgdB